MSGGSGEIVGPLGRTGGEGRGSLRMPGGVLILRLLIAAAIAALCLGSIASCAAAAPVLGENNTPGVPPAPGNTTGGEKPVTAKLPGTPDEPSEPAETSVTARPADIAATLEETPPPDITNATPSLSATATPEPIVSSPDGADGEETPVPTLEDSNVTASPEPTASILSTADDADDEDEPEGTPVPVPTLEREAPPRPNATMAKSHQYHDRPLAQGAHPLVRPTPLPEKNETVEQPEDVAPREGLFVRGVGVLLARTPEDVALTRSGVETANLDWLLDTAMRLGGRHPRVAMEGETFTVTVTVEAQSLAVTGEEPVYVVLVPPPGEVAIYDITRTKEPRNLLDGERAVWEFSVTTRVGRLMLENLTLPEERLITDLTSYPDAFAFRAYALAGTQEIPSMGLSDPVIVIRPAGSAAAEPSLPPLYTLVGVQDSLLDPSETMVDAWRRGIDYDAITAGAGEHLGTLANLGKEEVAAIYTAEGRAGAEAAAGPSSSPFDLIVEFFRSIFGWF